ncbi:MAG: S8 family serine peptidase [Candidatus Cloacimonetes bacterium]|nr:S8 family serine peptidase [Candidatus Cloacimonadota bacterium]
MPKSIYFLFLLLAVFSLLPARTMEYEAGWVVMKLRSPSSFSRHSTGSAALDSRLRQFGMQEVDNRFISSSKSDLSRILKVRIDTQFDPLGVCNALAGHPELEYIEPLYTDHILAVPDDTHYAASLNFPAMQADAAWDIHKCQDNPQIIAIVDTGVPWKHVDLAENIWNNLGEDFNANGYTMYDNGSAWVMDAGDLNGIDDDGNGKVDDLIGWNFMADAAGTENNDPSDPGSHGTRVSGLAGARTNNAIGAASLSWNPIIMAISCSRPGATSTIYRGYDAIIYAAENGARVINCSWGGTNFSYASNDAVAYAQSLGAIIVAAAGNSNNSIPIYPAAYPGVVAIASLMNDGTKWSGSNYGGYVDAGAPNESVYTLSGTTAYAMISGTTSYASPIGAAMLALISSQNPSWTSAEVINQMKATCDNIDAQNPGKENLLGGGRINAYLALSESNPSQTAKLHMQLFEVQSPSDDNANNAVEPGEHFSLNLRLRNFSDFSDQAQFVLSTTNPYAVINQNTEVATVPADNWLDLSDAFSINILPGSPSGYVNFTLAISSDTPVLSGSSSIIRILVHNGGHFVWEAKAGARNQSGVFIRNSLQSMGKQVVYGTTFPASFHGFEAVYLSFGAIDSNVGRLNNPTMFYAIKDYLEAGGRLYIEGADVVAWDMANYFPAIDGVHDGHEILWPLLGVSSASDGNTNPVSLLTGQPGPTANLSFSASNQTNNDFIDLFETIPGLAVPAFIEDDYGVVGIASAGGFDQRCILFSYALAELVDARADATRLDFLERIVDFYEAEELTLAVTLSSFFAQWQDAALLNWTTATETELLGWNIYRGQNPELHQAIKLNPILIPAEGEESLGASYSYQDTQIHEAGAYYYWLEALHYSGDGEYYGPITLNVPVPEEESPPEVPVPTTLFPLYPNPFNPSVNLRFSLAAPSDVSFKIYNNRGQLLRTINAGNLSAGYHNLEWNATDDLQQPLGSGVYLIRMQTASSVFVRKAVLMK